MAGAAVLAVSTAVAHADGGIPSSGEVTGVWTVSDTSTTFVDGALTFADGASVAIADESLFASAGRGGIPIAVAAGGIEGMPAMENYAFELKRSGVVNLHGGSRQIANLVGAPYVTNAATLTVAGLWTVEEGAPMMVDGALRFADGARVAIADEPFFLSGGHEGMVIATATGGITGIPRMEHLDFALRLSADGKSLIVYDNIPDVADWTVFSKKMSVAFGGVQSGVTLTNFPVLVRLSTAIDGFSYADFKRPDGEDLRFVDRDGNLIPHEIDTWNPDGVSTVWVKVPELTASTEVAAYYGCLHPVRAMPAKDVWDDDYVGVWHLGEATHGQSDSTSSGKEMEGSATYAANMAYGVDGAVGKAVELATPLDANGKYRGGVKASDSGGLYNDAKTLTVEAWACQREIVNDKYIVRNRSSSNNLYTARWSWSSGSETTKLCYTVALTNLTDGTGKNYSGVVYSVPTNEVLGAWRHYALVIDNESLHSIEAFEDGVSKKSQSIADASLALGGGSGFLCFGNADTGGSQAFPGTMDELRVSRVARSAAWLKATHDTVMRADFATYTVEAIEPQYVFAHEVGVAFTGCSGGSALSDFPVLVRLSQNIPGFSYADFRIDNGGDLRFFDADGRLLPHEVDTWNTNGVSSVWVKVPSLTASTAITAKYGCEAPPDNDPASVWSNGYVGVWHLGEGALPLKESSETSSDFRMSTGSGIGYASPGVVGKSVDFGESGKSRSVIAPDHDALDGFTACTFEAWTYMDAAARSFKKDGTDSAKGLLTKRAGYGNQTSYHLWDAGSGTSICISSNSTTHTAIAGIANVPSGEWVHQVVTFNAGSTANFKGGAAAGTGTTPVKKINAGDANLHLGNFQAGDTRNFPGKIDEVRISKVARSAAWVKATHDTIMNPNFATYSTSAGTLSGYGAWMNAKELVGAPAEVSANGIENGVRYAFDIAPENGPGAIGEPIIQVVRDAAGNPSVQSRDLATGRDDVTFGILATENLTDWSNATLVPMTKFATDGLWRPTASESAGYVFPAKMFFKYTLDIQQ